MSITTQLLLTVFATLTPTTGELRDLCDIVHTDTSKPIYCEPHHEGASRYDGTVCCDGRTCFEAREGYCLADETPFYCELGEVGASGKVSCFFEVPDYCDMFPCAPGFNSQPLEEAMCCNQGICWPTVTGSSDCEPQDIYWCSSGVSNADGTVTCLDDE
ncbi:hypothetical protein ENSA5_00800 [Enhygromyxa salina]|uniref:Uncharacterized protein n=1 Tax=Enhygromyxa salina TaxID=215803 RepID=A0A2S9YKX4_9BACT|nr:hypothetical protein [Enhygromyxa salina]PRQ05760.1 hypothetical protein ENSA5_00800 [Enhygromyxa salina]